MLARGLAAQPVSSLLLGSTWTFSLGGWVLVVLSQGWKMGRVKGVRLHLIFVVVAKDKGTLLFDFFFFVWEMGFFFLE